MNLDLYAKYPSIAHLARRAEKRIPFFAWEYLDSGTGSDHGIDRNLDAFRNVTLTPQFMKGQFEPEISTELFGVKYDAPFGVAPVGLTSLMWPGAELILAKTAAKYRIPFTLSTAATEGLETVGKTTDGMGWFQLYPPRDRDTRKDLLKRAADAGFTNLLVTVDVPASSRRERQAAAEVSVPPRQTFRTYFRAAIKPTWAISTLARGMPQFRVLEPYADTKDMVRFSHYMSQNFNGTVDWEYLKELRDEWPGPIVVKGVMDVDDARECVAIGMDGVGVSNHGARQCDGVPGAVEVLPEIARAVDGKAKVIFDSGVRTGIDICRALALGADFVMLGRAFVFAVSALGKGGGDHAADILIEDLKSSMSNLGCRTLDELPARARRPE